MAISRLKSSSNNGKKNKVDTEVAAVNSNADNITDTKPASEDQSISDFDQQIIDQDSELGNVLKSNGWTIEDLTSGELAFVIARGGDGDCEGYEGVGDQVSSGNFGGNFSLVKYLSGIIPRKKRDRIKRAYEYAECDDLLSSLLETAADFTVLGLGLQATPPIKFNVDTTTADQALEFQQELDDISLSIDIDKLVDDLVRDWFITDSMVLYWRIDLTVDPEGKVNETSVPADNDLNDDLDEYDNIPGLLEICALDIRDIDWNNSLGRDILTVDIAKEVVDRIKNALAYGKDKKISEAEVINSLIESGIGLKWIIAVKAGKESVTLSNADGDYWLIRTKARKYRGLADPKMKTIFGSLETRSMLGAGEFSAAFMMKHFIMLIKQGESIPTGPLAGSQRNWLKPKDATKLMRKFTVVAKAIRAVVNHTTKIEFVFPPKELFDATKFESPENRILNFIGISKVVMSGSGSDYGGGFLSVRKLIAKITKTRQEINILIKRFFLHSSIKKRIKIPDRFQVEAVFDNNVLKEPRQLLEEIKFMYEGKISNPRSAARELGRNPDALKSSTIQSQKEEEKLHVWSGVGGQNNFGSSNPGGRPANPETTPNEQTRTQAPAGAVTSDM